MPKRYDTREARAIEQIDCPRCGARAGQHCRALSAGDMQRATQGLAPCHGERRRANQERRRIARATGEGL